MDYEVVPRFVKYVIGCWTLPKSILVYTKEKLSESDHGGWDPQMTDFKAYVILWHGPMGLVVGEAK